MHSQGFFIQALIYLLAAVISVPIAKRLGLGSILGYLIAGIIIGPYVLGLVGQEGTNIMGFAEFGVVMMLFLVGLELKPSLLWKMRRSIFGLGGGQVIITAIIIGAISMAFKMNIYQAIAIGLILALSSTAIVLQSYTERRQMKTEAGKDSFSVLLFQDIAVIPILALLPLFAGQVELVSTAGHSEHATGVAALPGWQQVLIIIAVVGGIIFTGRFLARYIFRFIAGTGLREIFTAAALLMVVAIALGMEAVGLSPALGTFLAGVVLADNEYRHELESDIEPFKGLLLGLFFIAVGSSISFGTLRESPGIIAAGVGILLVVKFLVLYVVGRIHGLKAGQELLFSFSLAQAGEFAFVLISFSSQNAIFGDEVAGVLLIIVALSMLMTPLMLIINDKLVQPAITSSKNKPEADEIEENENPVIIAGYGRFGVVLGRFLKTNQIKATILDDSPDNIQILRKFGHKVFYGDALRPDLLEKAGASTAKALVIAFEDEEKITHLVKYVRRKYPHLRIFSRAVNVRHSFELQDLGVEGLRKEVYDSSLELGKQTLCSLGFTRYQANRAARAFKFHDEEIMRELYKSHKEKISRKNYIDQVREFSEQLENIFLAEQEHILHESDSAFDIETRREEIREMEEEKLKEQNEGDMSS